MELKEQNLPLDFINRMKQNLDKQSYQAYLDTIQSPFLRILRVNTLKTNSTFIEEKLGSEIQATDFLPNSYFVSDSLQVNSNPYHFAGLYYMQELSAQYPVSLLNPKPNEVILDLCAAPGGKTTQIAAYMENTGLLISNEINSSRAQILNSNLERLGVKNSIVVNMSPSDLCPLLNETCDAVLVDAPCSGEGMFRRDPQAIQEWSLNNVQLCQKRQMSILDSVSSCVVPGGRLVYSTCTFSKEEDEDVVEWFLKEHPDYELLKMKKIYPHMSKGDGQFAALFIRKGSTQKKNLVPSLFKNNKADIKIVEEFLKSGFNEENQNLYISPKNKKCYILPSIVPETLQKMHLVRAGILAGEICQNRFEPDHCLYMSHSANEFINTIPIEYDDYIRFITGNVLKCNESLKGFTAVLFDDFPIGFGKAVNGMLKNHLPKGLRINL